MWDIVAIGEALIDFSPLGKGKMGNPSFEMNPGGAPANCLAAASALGGNCALISMVGNDFLGDFLIDSIKKRNIHTCGIKRTDQARTTAAFVNIKENGEREFSFFRMPGADILLSEADVDMALIDEARFVHFGSLSLTNEPSRTATLNVINYAKRKGKKISYDPNYRPLLWESREIAVEWMKKGMDLADIVKISDEELEIIYGYGIPEIEQGAEEIFRQGKELVLVTCGNKGAIYKTQHESGFCQGYAVDAIDTTGCGDAFFGAMLYLICHEKNMSMTDKVDFANAAGALCATRMGGLPAMPSITEVRNLLKE